MGIRTVGWSRAAPLRQDPAWPSPPVPDDRDLRDPGRGSCSRTCVQPCSPPFTPSLGETTGNYSSSALSKSTQLGKTCSRSSEPVLFPL